MRITVLLERSVSCDKCLVDSLETAPNIVSQHRCDFLFRPTVAVAGRCDIWFYPVGFSSPWIGPGSASLWVWLERFCHQSPFELVVEFGKLISSRNRPLKSWSSPARNILLLIHWNWKIKLWSSNCDLPGKQKSWLIWYKMTAVIKWMHPFRPPCVRPKSNCAYLPLFCEHPHDRARRSGDFGGL